jgi:predicted transcriptional regulator
MTVAFFVIVGLVVDGGGKVRATQEADAIAREAARAAGQELARDSQAQGSRVVTLNTTAARAAARDYLAAAGATGSVSVQDATITVTATVAYKPVFLTALGPMVVTGTATARTVRAFEGEER